MIREKKFNKLPSKKRQIRSQILMGRVSSSVSAEAAFAAPLFLIAIVTMIYFFELLAVQNSVRSGLQYAEKTIAEKGYIQRMVSPGTIQNYVEEEIGPERLARSIVDGGISCRKSYISPASGIGELKATYKVRIPVPFFSLASTERTESMMCKLWCGYEKGGFQKDKEDIVYITETGVVYHLDYNCTYLDLSIRPISPGALDSARNGSGGKYHACEFCRPGRTGALYITTYGDRYHGSLSCSGLKRTVYSVPKSEAIGKGACSRCAR